METPRQRISGSKGGVTDRKEGPSSHLFVGISCQETLPIANKD